MELVCLDLEGVLVPEIWIAFAEKTGIPEFKRTTRDEPDYDKLMHYRMDLLDKHGLGLNEITDAISRIEPLIGAHEFLDKLRERTQVMILSDTFDQFGRPLMKKLNWPTLFCNSLLVSPEGKITGYKKDTNVVGTYNVVISGAEGNLDIMPDYQLQCADLSGLMNYDTRLNLGLELTLKPDGTYSLFSDAFCIEAGKRAVIGDDTGLGMISTMKAEGA